MGLFDILFGTTPLLKACKKAASPEQSLVPYLNRGDGFNNQYIPRPGQGVVEFNAAAVAAKPETVSGRYTLNPGSRVKILDTGGEQWDVFITVPDNGVTAYATHDSTRILNTAISLHEGIPLTNNPNVDGRPTANVLRWRGEMWMTGDTPNMVVDVEAS